MMDENWRIEDDWRLFRVPGAGNGRKGYRRTTRFLNAFRAFNYGRVDKMSEAEYAKLTKIARALGRKRIVSRQPTPEMVEKARWFLYNGRRVFLGREQLTLADWRDWRAFNAERWKQAKRPMSYDSYVEWLDERTSPGEQVA